MLDRGRRPGAVKWRFTGALVALVATACDRTADPAPPPPVASVSSAVSSAPTRAAEPVPPFRKFELQPWQSVHNDAKPVMPPESLVGPARVWVNQERPRQKKNPKWQTVDGRKAVELELASDGRWRCILNPLEIRARPDEDEAKVEAWHVQRSVLCSSDGWKTWTEHPHVDLVNPDGEKQASMSEQTEIFLRELVGGRTRETTIVVRTGTIAPKSGSSGKD